ncbi:UDP-N-acetylglucosamine--N-acetylmuramyl-(pentapeptide) pyrophosphoryl-undecaprenol N-acetylglucosamine transferase [hydrothermal vent metagenome]|uniref:UDP-N-acetylglucosamine--N-acetylmuramyl-(Pentapeptide) pyrophosphoryl-undecaprenol N-acetylglucosamine transferase n=1 Tax=hydrothermal vent metagenome TaxID=652676 RepID=A0A3B0Z707_9ZZZZ
MVTRIMIMAGGTGGHVFPALAVAQELQSRGVEVIWMGTRRGIEAKVVPDAGIPIEWISVSGLRGKGVVSWLLAPFKLVSALFQSFVIIMRCRPMAVLGMGGFVAGPGGLMTWILHKPLVIHEQNAIAGLTNRLLARIATKAMQAFPNALQKKTNPQLVGNPVRQAIAALPIPELRFEKRTGALRLLVLGGSLGAQSLNQVIPAAMNIIPEAELPEIWHQAGERLIDEARDCYQNAAIDARIEPFIDDMAVAYGWADLVLCRAGALTIAELSAAGVAALLVPYPYAVDDHQAHNAAYLVDAGAALLVRQDELGAEKLALLWQGLYQQYGDVAGVRMHLLGMATKGRKLAKCDAAKQVADVCMEVAHA